MTFWKKAICWSALLLGLPILLPIEPAPAQGLTPPEVVLDSFMVRASTFLGGRVDTFDLRLVAEAVVRGDSVKHRWMVGFGPVELRSEETYRSFPGIRFFRFFTFNMITPPGHCVAIDREGGKAYLIYQSGAPDDLGELVLSLGVQIASEPAALEYFMDVLQLRGLVPSVVLDSVAEIRRYANYRERVPGLKLSELPPIRRMYRHLSSDPSFEIFKKGSLPEEQDTVCRRVEAAWAPTIRPPAVDFHKGQYHVNLFLTKTRNLFEIFKISGFVSPEGLVGYTVTKLK